MPYLDTSLLVAALTREARTAAVQQWLTDQDRSNWSYPKERDRVFRGTLHEGPDTAPRRGGSRRCARGVHDTVRDSFSVLPVAREDFRTAARLADAHESGLRAGDALHLGIVANHGERLLSLARIQVKAALTVGISARLF